MVACCMYSHVQIAASVLTVDSLQDADGSALGDEMDGFSHVIATQQACGVRILVASRLRHGPWTQLGTFSHCWQYARCKQLPRPVGKFSHCWQQARRKQQPRDLGKFSHCWQQARCKHLPRMCCICAHGHSGSQVLTAPPTE
jgi:hypothetical protein